MGGRNIVYYDSVDSTNLRIKQMGDEGAPEGTLAVADKQTAGRGRRPFLGFTVRFKHLHVLVASSGD